MNECVTDNGGCSQTCTNLVGGFSCGCYTGYQQVGSLCQVPGMCQLFNLMSAFIQLLLTATCFPSECDHSCVLDSSNIASCVCKPGYELDDDGMTCIGMYELLCNCIAAAMTLKFVFYNPNSNMYNFSGNC